MVRFLLDSAARVDATTAVGYTPLHQAAQQGHCAIVNTLLEHGAPPNATTNQGQTAMSIAQKLGYISVVETLKGVTETATITPLGEEKYKVVSPETMQETFMSDSEDEGGEDTLLSEQPYRYLTVDEMKSLGDDSLPIDVRQDERQDSNRECMSVPPTAVDDTISPQHLKEAYSQFTTPDNVDIARHPLHVGFLVSFLVDARGGAMRGCRHSGVRVIVPPRRASMPMRVTCRYLRRDKLTHPPPLMEGEALASRILELGPVGAKFLGPVMIEVPHFGSLRGKEREIVILRSDNGETWREHTVDCSEEAVQDVLNHSFDKEDLAQLDESSRTTRILTSDFPHYFAVVTRVRQEVHAIGPEGGMVSSSVVPQVQAVFPQGALTKKIKVGLQAQPIPAELAAKLLGNRVAVSPIVTVEPRRRKFHKPITLTIPKPQAANKGMINQYSGDAPTLRLLCSITGGTTRAQWEDVTGSTPFTFVNDCVSFTTTVSARFWLMDCRNVGDATKMATELYREAIHVPFMAKFVVFAKRVDPLEARLRIFCMTDDKEDKTLEHQEHFTEVAKSRDVEVLEGKTQYIEFAGNLVPVTKSGEQLQLGFRAFRENRLPFTGRVKDPHADPVGRTLFMREARLPKGEPPQQPICVLNIVLPDEIIPEAPISEHELHKYSFTQDSRGLESYQRVDLRLSDVSNLLGEDWVGLAHELSVSPSDINRLKTEHPQSSAQQGLAMLRLWLAQAGNKAQASTLESALQKIGRDDIVQQCVFNVDHSGVQLLKDESRDASLRRSIPYSDKDIMKDSESVEDLSRTQFRKKSDFSEKDDKEERKYEAEEKEVEEVKKSVSERRQEIEKRLSLEKPITLKTETSIDKIGAEKIEDVSEKEIAEEKRVSSPEEDEPSELSFEQKRLSFEQGKRVIEMKPDKTTMKEVKERADERFLAEERKAAEALQEKKALIDETSIPFEEKRKSFEKSEKEEKLKEEKLKEKREESKKEDIRRDSALFEGVSQGLVRLDAAFTAAPQVQDLLSPKASKTPPPSPAEFKDLTGTVAWTDDTSAAVPSNVDQSQDWAEKGRPDSTIDASNKEHLSACLDNSRQQIIEPRRNTTDHSTLTNKPQQFTETINIETHEHFADEVKEKEAKYNFTMAVSNKEDFKEMKNKLSSFLENERNYIMLFDPSGQTGVPVSVNTEVTSSDETEECQSKSESDPKSDKSFVGKMSQKIFGVFKKDEKGKSKNKKQKSKKNKKESNKNENSVNFSDRNDTDAIKEEVKAGSSNADLTNISSPASNIDQLSNDFRADSVSGSQNVKEHVNNGVISKSVDLIDNSKRNVIDINTSAVQSTEVVPQNQTTKTLKELAAELVTEKEPNTFEQLNSNAIAIANETTLPKVELNEVTSMIEQDSKGEDSVLDTISNIKGDKCHDFEETSTVKPLTTQSEFSTASESHVHSNITEGLEAVQEVSVGENNTDNVRNGSKMKSSLLPQDVTGGFEQEVDKEFTDGVTSVGHKPDEPKGSTIGVNLSLDALKDIPLSPVMEMKHANLEHITEEHIKKNQSEIVNVIEEKANYLADNATSVKKTIEVAGLKDLLNFVAQPSLNSTNSVILEKKSKPNETTENQETISPCPQLEETDLKQSDEHSSDEVIPEMIKNKNQKIKSFFGGLFGDSKDTKNKKTSVTSEDRNETFQITNQRQSDGNDQIISVLNIENKEVCPTEPKIEDINYDKSHEETTMISSLDSGGLKGDNFSQEHEPFTIQETTKSEKLVKEIDITKSKNTTDEVVSESPEQKIVDSFVFLPETNKTLSNKYTEDLVGKSDNIKQNLQFDLGLKVPHKNDVHTGDVASIKIDDIHEFQPVNERSEYLGDESQGEESILAAKTDMVIKKNTNPEIENSIESISLPQNLNVERFAQVQENVIHVIKTTTENVKSTPESMSEISAETLTAYGSDKQLPEDINKSTTIDEKLNNMLIDMLIEQECLKTSNQETPSDSKKQNDQPTYTKKNDNKSLEEISELRAVHSFGKIESLISESDLRKILEQETLSEKPYVTTPTMQRRKIGGSQRLSREERPTLREIAYLSDYSSSDEEVNNRYIVTEPIDPSARKVSFHVESEDETFLRVSDSNSEPDIDVTEMTPSPLPPLKEQDPMDMFTDKEKYTDEQKKIKKVEQRFERMASETLEADPDVKYTADREFQRMISQLSAEEVEACISQWNDEGLTPSEEQDSSNTTTEGELGPDVGALPEATLATTNPFYAQSSQWIEFEHGIGNIPSSIFWAFDTAPPSGVIQPNELDIPVKHKRSKGEATGDEVEGSTSPATSRETDEALLDLAAGLQDNKGTSSGVGPSNSK